MNYIWAGIILSSFVYSFLSGNLYGFGQAMINSSSDAVDFIISLAGVMAMWSGLMEIAEKTGLIHRLSSLLLPLTKLLFPHQKDPETLSCIIMSFMSNLFGAGNSSTVFALRTMEKLDRQNNHSTLASNDMCTFAVVNMAIAPVIPLITVQMREKLGSSDPYSIVAPAFVSSLLVIGVSIISCKIAERKKQ
ncbi:MAG: hypothetical protein IKW01_01560 [Firmicutes bacterium]|nr:hypothetical protein [Bacillota bacterium]